MANRYAIAPGVVQLASGACVYVVPGALFASGGAVVAAAPALPVAGLDVSGLTGLGGAGWPATASRWPLASASSRRRRTFMSSRRTIIWMVRP